MRSGCEVESGEPPEESRGACVRLEDGAGGRRPRRCIPGPRGQAPASFSPLVFTRLRGSGLCTGEFRGLVKHQCA